jgi:BirA family biotin operon repressor/biotin-[acetyl-CoA-carboxylase] ligase
MTAEPWEIIRLEEIGSTNDEVRRLALAGAAHGTVIVAEAQTAGRGRRGSVWVSPPGRNLLCSILLRPDWPVEQWPRLTHVIALAICEALEDAGVSPQIKWPNDLYLNGRKFCGILLEMASSPQGMFVVIGFGLNVNLTEEEFPADLLASATSLRIATERIWDRESLLQSILRSLASRAEMAAQNFSTILEAVAARSFLIGKRISLRINDCERLGRVLGLTSQGGLHFLPDDGPAEEVLSADLVRPLVSERFSQK